MPWSKNLTFTDPFPCLVAIQGSDTELLPTAKGDFVGEITQVRMNRLWMQRFHMNLSHVSTVKMMSGRVALGFLTDEHQPAMQHCGTEVSPNDIIVNDFDVLHHRFGADVRYGSMSLTLDELHDTCQAITGRQFEQPTSRRYLRPDHPHLMSRLLKLHETVGHMARSNPALLERTEVARALEHQLIHLMVRCLTEGGTSKVSHGVRRHDMIVARFEEFMEANPDQPLYLAEICAALNTTERTLRHAYEEHLGMGPIRYLTLRRMHLVRRALLRTKSSTTVTKILTDHGFWELGRFAVQYKALFGESPSVSLQRQPRH